MQTEYIRTESGLLLPDHCYQKRPIAIDLFCGCGGFSLGMIDGGFRVVAAVDQDPSAALTYLANLGSYPVDLHFIQNTDRQGFEQVLSRGGGQSSTTGIVQPFTSGQHRPSDCPGVDHFWLGDICRLTGQEMLDAIGVSAGQVDCVFGGPPCQGFTRIGKRDVHDPRNSLLFEFARLILEINPKTFVMENVPDIISQVTPDGIPVLDAFCRVLADGEFSGYDALRRGLQHQAQSWGAIANPQIDSKPKKSQPQSSVDMTQLVFFEVGERQ
jgi:DNA (cytosine-5)-methyltransferase 1